ncbi:type II toxin-antitoxin system Phd/YefM family antitoxin [Dethiobacter alkaliphilus]|uniref:type II toxin-antitoxin system Phd/YefM family antitoxin n=1 Tax=Dethiobacter alkaliphilus TaxID=427926 RepID=UPI002226E30D|nr:type II toxin-antitoxin system Phd/YefM family antitoxin [Dethiobacter alkaliphilus]MCW3490207.1 type II toxin-antitoxin system Phd/YefM family antitoxin [Dethiobacter alkaliphilus]
MKFVSVRDLRQKSAEIWGLLREEGDVVITSNGKPIALLSDIGEANVEEYLQNSRRLRATMAVNSMQERSLQQGLNELSDEEIEAEIKDTRQKR